jgi:hypothetical protein
VIAGTISFLRFSRPFSSSSVDHNVLPRRLPMRGYYMHGCYHHGPHSCQCHQQMKHETESPVTTSTNQNCQLLRAWRLPTPPQKGSAYGLCCLASLPSIRNVDAQEVHEQHNPRRVPKLSGVAQGQPVKPTILFDRHACFLPRQNSVV